MTGASKLRCGAVLRRTVVVGRSNAGARSCRTAGTLVASGAWRAEFRPSHAARAGAWRPARQPWAPREPVAAGKPCCHPAGRAADKRSRSGRVGLAVAGGAASVLPPGLPAAPRAATPVIVSIAALPPARFAIGPNRRSGGGRRTIDTSRTAATRAVIVADRRAAIQRGAPVGHRPGDRRGRRASSRRVVPAGHGRGCHDVSTSAATAPIVQIVIAQRVTVAISVEHPQAIAWIIIIVVPATAEPDIDEPPP